MIQFQGAKYLVHVGGILLCISPCDGSTDITAEICLCLVDSRNRELPRNISTRKIGNSLDVVLPHLLSAGNGRWFDKRRAGSDDNWKEDFICFLPKVALAVQGTR